MMTVIAINQQICHHQGYPNWHSYCCFCCCCPEHQWYPHWLFLMKHWLHPSVVFLGIWWSLSITFGPFCWLLPCHLYSLSFWVVPSIYCSPFLPVWCLSFSCKNVFASGFHLVLCCCCHHHHHCFPNPNPSIKWQTIGGWWRRLEILIIIKNIYVNVIYYSLFRLSSLSSVVFFRN